MPKVVRLLLLTSRVASAFAQDVKTDDLQDADLRLVAALHMECLEGGLFRRLGRHFLAGYYETFVSSPYGLAVALRQKGELCGYVVGTVDDASHYAWVMQNRGRRLAMSGFFAMLLRPPVLASFMRTRVTKYLKGVFKLNRASNHEGTSSEKGGSLTHIVVAPPYQRKGLGNVLVEDFVSRAHAGKARRLQLLTNSANIRACSFYRSIGWHESGQKASPDGAAMVVFTLALDHVRAVD